jgi:two-component system sensor histidine kinase KdpD
MRGLYVRLMADPGNCLIMNARRLDADAVLARLREETRRVARGRLKILFGAAAGIGTTYAILRATQTRRTAGIDVILGPIESNKRPATERLAEGLQGVPARRVARGGAQHRECNLNAVLRRKPALNLMFASALPRLRARI